MILRSRAALPLVVLATTAALLVPAPAGASTTLGQIFTPDAPCGASFDGFTEERLDGGNPAAPAAGVITSWSYMAGSLASAVTLRVFHHPPGGASGDYQVVFDGGALQSVASSSGLHTYPSRVPISAGDLIGLRAVGGYCVKTTSAGPAPFDVARVKVGPATAVGSTGSYLGNPHVAVDVSAVFERDLDNDGYGDDTQDLCPTSNLTQGACPAPDTTITKKPKGSHRGRTSKLKFTSTIPGSTYSCTIDKKTAKACTSPAKFKCLKRGKHTFSVTAASPFGTLDPTAASAKFRVPRNRHGC